METKSNVKQNLKKSAMTTEKQKKSNNKKKKKNKKPQSATKFDQSPDQLEIEGVGALDQQGVESDSSCPRNPGSESPSLSQRPASLPDDRSDAQVKSVTSSQCLSEIKKNVVSSSSLEDTVSNMTLKNKTSSQKGLSKTKVSNSKSGSGGAKNNTKQTKVDSAKTKAAQLAAIKTAESLRWENQLQDEEKELERIRLYKINRRKRYLAAAQAKGLGWVVNYGTNGSPVSEDSGIEMHDRDVHTTVSDFSTVRSLMPTSQNSTPLGLTTSEYMY